MEILIPVAAFFVFALLSSVRILNQYEQGVVFRLGRAKKDPLGPGVRLLLPFGIDRMRVVDTRIKVMNIPPQDVITRDNISIMVDAVLYASVASPQHAILEVENYIPATELLAATTLRAVIGKMDLDEILAKRDSINHEVRDILDTRTEQWGVEITAVELKDIILPHEMKRAMARQAEAERERRAKVIAAEGEVQSATMLAQAAETMSVHPGALQLRLYQTLVEVSGEANSTIVFPVPIELLGAHSTGRRPDVSDADATALQAKAASVQAMMASAVSLAGAAKGNLPAPRATQPRETRPDYVPVATRKRPSSDDER